MTTRYFDLATMVLYIIVVIKKKTDYTVGVAYEIY